MSQIVGLVVLTNDGRPGNSRMRTDGILSSRPAIFSSCPTSRNERRRRTTFCRPVSSRALGSPPAGPYGGPGRLQTLPLSLQISLQPPNALVTLSWTLLSSFFFLLRFPKPRSLNLSCACACHGKVHYYLLQYTHSIFQVPTHGLVDWDTTGVLGYSGSWPYMLPLRSCVFLCL